MEEQILSLSEALKKLSDFSDEKGTRISYQVFKQDEEGDVPVFLIENGNVSFRTDSLNPGFIHVSIAFGSCEDPALRLAWRNLERFGGELKDHPEKGWIFYMDITKFVEGNPLKEDSSDRLLSVHIANPIMWCITRSAPTQECSEEKSDTELCGGDTLKLVVRDDLFEIEENDNADVTDLKSEYLRKLNESDPEE